MAGTSAGKARTAAGRLEAYRRKRRFERTSEPRGGERGAATRSVFVIHKHDASRAHYDFRLELDGVLLSWAVPKGPSLDPAAKRLAVQVEDHPLEYADFEGVIPADEYGGGTVMVWDRGEWQPRGDARKGYRDGHLSFSLAGTKLSGGWSLVRTGLDGGKKGHNWLLIKRKDRAAGKRDVLAEDRSVASGRTMKEIAAAADRVWSSAAPAPAAKRSGRAKAKGKVVTRNPEVSRATGARRAPMPRVMRPQLATAAARVPEGEGWLQELKYDGYRIVAFVAGSDVRLVTRNGNDWTDRFPSVRDALAKLGWKSAVVDGEIVAETAEGGMSFQSLQNALRSRGKSPDIGYYLFDLPYFGGYDLAAAPLVQRKEVLRSLLAGVPRDSRLRFSDHIAGGGRDFLRFACRSAMEGVVCKKADGRYREGRSRDWLKVKCINRQEFVIGGFTDPAGSRVGFGALLLGYYEADGKLRYCGRVGTGFDQRALRQLATMLKKAERKKPPFFNPPRGSFHWTEPLLVAEVEFTEWTADGMLRQPSFEGLREDKEAADVRKEQPSARPATKVNNPRGKGVATNVVAGVRLTNPDRVVYPEQGITKRELAEYYVAVADLMLPHVADRPLMVVRCPKGSGDACFYQKHVTETLPKAVRALEVEEEEGTASYIAVHGVDGLVSLVQMGVLEFHPWGSRGANLERPDRMIFDLDPAEGVEWAQVVASARRLRDVMKSLRLASFVRTTGGKGLHVVVPLAEISDWDEVKAVAAATVRELAAAYPDEYVATMSKKARKGKIFVDHFRNGRGATAIASYSTRARPRAPVATPLAWDELSPDVKPGQFTVATLPRRLGALKEDPWKDFSERRRSISKAALRALRVSP